MVVTRRRLPLASVPSQSLPWRTESSHNPVVTPINDPTGPFCDHTSNSCARKVNRYQDKYPVASRSRPTTLPSGATFFHPPLALLSLEKLGVIAITTTKQTLLQSYCRHAFNNARSCWNNELGELDEDGANRRRYVPTTSYRRDGKYPSPNSHKQTASIVQINR